MRQEIVGVGARSANYSQSLGYIIDGLFYGSPKCSDHMRIVIFSHFVMNTRAASSPIRLRSDRAHMHVFFVALIRITFCVTHMYTVFLIPPDVRMFVTNHRLQKGVLWPLCIKARRASLLRE